MRKIRTGEALRAFREEIGKDNFDRVYMPDVDMVALSSDEIGDIRRELETRTFWLSEDHNFPLLYKSMVSEVLYKKYPDLKLPPALVTCFGNDRIGIAWYTEEGVIEWETKIPENINIVEV